MNRRSHRSVLCGLGLISGTFCWLVGCGEASSEPNLGPRPVEVSELRVSDPTVKLRLPGIVRSWAEEDIAFEVSGKVDFIMQEGARVTGRWADSDVVLVDGDVLARLDPEEYEADVAASQAELEAALIKRDRVAPAQ